MHLHGFEVGDEDRALLQRQLLVAEEKLCRAQLEGLLAPVQHVAQDHMDHLLDEERRDVHATRPEELEVGALDRAGGKEPLPEPQHDLVIVARVLVHDRRQIGLGDGAARRLHHRRVQGALGVARLLHGMDLGTQVVGAQEIVADGEPAPGIALEQVETAIAPEIRQGRGPVCCAPTRAASGIPSGRRRSVDW